MFSSISVPPLAGLHLALGMGSLTGAASALAKRTAAAEFAMSTDLL